MKQIIKVDSVPMSQLKNATFLSLSQRAYAEVDALEDSTQLGISAADLSQWKSDNDKLQLAVNAQRASTDTDPRSGVDRQRDSYFIGLKSGIEAGLRSPVAATVAAANALDFVIAPYKNIQNTAMNDETEQMNGLILALEPYSTQLTTLGLTEIYEAMKEANEEFTALTQARAKERAGGKLEDTKVVRARIQQDWDWVTACINASYILGDAETAAAAQALIAILNQIIWEVKDQIGETNQKEDGTTPVTPDEGTDDGGDETPTEPEEPDDERPGGL